MPQNRDMMEAEALDWVIRMRDPAFDDWEFFEAWLATDPAHADAWNSLAAADADMSPLLEALPDPDLTREPSPVRGSHRRWIGAGLAASLALVLGYGVFTSRSETYVMQTGPGQRQEISLSDGSSITLNGDTRIVLDRRDERFASLEHGEALFAVRHDAEKPFRVHVGDARLVDIGTRFNVVRSGSETRVAVSEGAVVYNPEGEDIRLDQGRGLQTRDGDPTIVVTDVAPATIAAWKDGRLVYDGQTLSAVAEDLSRYYGVKIRVSPNIAAQPYRGVLSLKAHADPAMLGPLLEAKIIRENGGWTILASR